MSAVQMQTIFILPFLAVSATAWSASASEATIEAARAVPSPALAIDRHFALKPDTPAWDTETIEIEAALPRLAQHGHLRAIRRLLPFGRPAYEVLAMEGDPTVRRQVIGRYLSAEAEAASLSPGSVAITPANYRFRYIASISDGKTLTYVYEISPRKKRAGLIKGQLWIDAETGMTVRQTGYLVRTPSVFIRRITVTRDTLLRDGVAYAKTTRVEIDTRVVGLAKLTITERPQSPEADDNGRVTRESDESACESDVN